MSTLHQDNTTQAGSLIAQGIALLVSNGQTSPAVAHATDDVMDAIQTLVDQTRVLVRDSKNGVEIKGRQRNRVRRAIKSLKQAMPGKIIGLDGDIGDGDYRELYGDDHD